MRTHYTNLNFHNTALPGLGSIGRTPHESCHSPQSESVDKTGNFPRNGIFSEFSPLQVMHDNFTNARKFISKQKQNLYGINDNLNLMHRTLKETSYSSGNRSKNYANHRICLQSLYELSHERFMNHPLFGDGSNPPLRLHLKIKGNEITHSIPISPLFNSASFLGILYSGHLPDIPSASTFDSSITAVFQFILENEIENSRLVSLLDSLENTRPASSDGVLKPRQESNLKNSKTMKRFVSRVLKLIKNATRSELCTEHNSLRPY